MDNILCEISLEEFMLLTQNTGVTEDEIDQTAQSASDGSEAQNG